MIVVKSLAGVAQEHLYDAWNDAFSNYAASWTNEALKSMLQRRGYNPLLSFGAFDGEQLVSFTLNGVGVWNNINTAYDTGTGTIKAYRGQGLSAKVFRESIPVLKDNGIEQYLLEVLQDNHPAIKTYKKLGFEVVRELNYYVFEKEQLQLPDSHLPGNYELKTTGIDATVMNRMWDIEPSWQNSFAAIARQPERFLISGVYEGENLAGYGIVEQCRGDIPQIAVAKELRRRGIGTAILKELVRHSGGMVRIINVDVACASLAGFLLSFGVEKSGMQYEMTRQL